MKDAMKMLNIMVMKTKMNEEEKDALLCELICTYVNKNKSDLMDLLLKEDFLGFQAHVKHYTTQGSKITKETLGEK